MYAARLGGVPGVADVRSRRRTPSSLDCRGIFAFRPEHEDEMVQLFEARQPVEFEGVVDDEPRRLMVTLITVDQVSGIAFFEGYGESAEAHRRTSPQAG
jgi:hypothetical protein